MARARSPNRDKAFLMFLESNGTILLKEIANQLNIDDSLVRRWKKQDNWEYKMNSHVTIESSETNSHVTIEKKKKGPPKANKNAKSNKGGHPPIGNQNALKHGLFSKYIPQETLEIMNQVAGSSSADMIWFQIELQFAAIIRSQNIMLVESKSEMIKELKKEKLELVNEIDEQGNITSLPTFSEKEYELQFSWDRQATYLTAQSRAMAELRNLIKQFEDIASTDDIRRLQIEQMRLNIKKSELEINHLSPDLNDSQDSIDNFNKATIPLQKSIIEVFDDED